MAMIHVNRGATSLGAFSEEEVREGLRTGRFFPSDIGWREGMANWQPLSQFPELAAAAPAAPPPQTGVAAPPVSVAPRSGLPWEHRQERGFFNAFIETLAMVLTKPGEAFTAMKREGGLGEPLLYALVGGSFGLIIYFLFMFLMPSVASFGGKENPLTHAVGAGIGSIFLVILVPIWVAIAAFISSVILHVCLMIVGGAKQSFETTFRVVCFSMGSTDPLIIIPFCGGLIASVWRIVATCIGLARAHETDTGRAVLAVFLPLVVCCGGGLLFGIMIGAWGAMGGAHH
jgi:hypothetical protein